MSEEVLFATIKGIYGKKLKTYIPFRKIPRPIRVKTKKKVDSPYFT